MQRKLLGRQLFDSVKENLIDFPVVAILGPRQVGKSTLAKQLLLQFPKIVYLDLENNTDLQKLADPTLFFESNRDRLICIDEIQLKPNLFPIMRSLIDKYDRTLRFLILGSASFELIQQSSETLAGRIAYSELTPFTFLELEKAFFDTDLLMQHWTRGGFPDSYLARNDTQSMVWRENFIRTFLERDLSQLGVSISSLNIRRLWQMCAHSHGQILNYSKLGDSIGFSHNTIRHYIDLLCQTFMLRVLPPFYTNLKKRIVKSPKVYVRDTGILHALLGIQDQNGLFGHPCFGASFEGYVIENIIASFPFWDFSFYRTSDGTEVDLIMQRGLEKIAIECKASTSPSVGKGFWNVLNDLDISNAWIIAPINETYQLKKGVHVGSLKDFLRAQKNDRLST